MTTFVYPSSPWSSQEFPGKRHTLTTLEGEIARDVRKITWYPYGSGGNYDTFKYIVIPKSVTDLGQVWQLNAKTIVFEGDRPDMFFFEPDEY